MEPMKAERPMKQICPAFAALIVAGAIVASAVSSAAAASGRLDATHLVHLSLSRYASVRTLDAGQTVGVEPAVLHVHVGDRVVFVNDDTAHHTATALGDAADFVGDPRWTDDALRATGEIGSAFWTSGDLAPGARSAPIVARKPGTYLYGCFFDYSAGMRGEIVVEP